MQENEKNTKDDTKDNSVEKAKKSFWASKKVKKFISALHSPAAIGIYVSIVFTVSAYQFYEVRSLNGSQRKSNLIFDAIEWIDEKTTDARFKVRGEIAPEAPVALLTIDDRSIEEVGRWPWSRDKIAEIVQKMMDLGAKAIGFDIVFSEPQIDSGSDLLKKLDIFGVQLNPNVLSFLEVEKRKSHPDHILADAFQKNADRIVLGAFNEESSSSFRPYQDYCRNVAFSRANSKKFVKINVTFVVEDKADPFEELDFDGILGGIFDNIDKTNTASILKNEFKKTNINDLNSLEKQKLKYLLEKENFRYCENWLDKEDDYKKLEDVQKAYLAIFAKSPALKDLSFEEAIDKIKTTVKNHPVVQQSHWTINIDELQENINYTAAFNAEQDSDGTIRKASMFFRTGNKFGTSFIPSLALQTYLAATNYRADVKIDVDPRNSKQKIISEFTIMDPNQTPEIEVGKIPVDEQGRMKINYAGGTYMYPHFPAKDLFNDNPEAEITQMKYNKEAARWVPETIKVNKAEFIKGRSFIFGATAIGVYDLRVTPFEKNYPGPETHLNALGNMFQRNFIQTHPNEERYMVTALAILGIIIAIGMAQAGAILGFLITALSGVIIFFFDQFLFKHGISATMALPALLVVSLYVVLTFYKYFTEERKKKQIRSTFSKYVSPAIVDEILKDPENVNLGGKRLRMTIFFSDLRNFTTISEKLQPTELSDVLNLYLTPMTQIVFANKGTLDKYIGDAVMAFFGAPVSFPDHAVYACRCALASMAKLQNIRDEINRQFPGKNIPIEIGIGINTADVSVGNMGSDIVRSYTVMGDGVNLASRLEGITKEYGVKIVISEFTYADVKDKFTCRELDWVRVKGKYKPVTIYELINEGPPTAHWADNLTHFNSGFSLYHEKKFAEAKVAFEKALASRPEDQVSKLYIGRCDDYLKEAPETDWDGVYVFTKK